MPAGSRGTAAVLRDTGAASLVSESQQTFLSPNSPKSMPFFKRFKNIQGGSERAYWLHESMQSSHAGCVRGSEGHMGCVRGSGGAYGLCEVVQGSHMGWFRGSKGDILGM